MIPPEVKQATKIEVGWKEKVVNEDNICKECDGYGYLDLVEANKNNKVAKMCDECLGEGTAHGEYYSFYDGTEYEGFYK